MSPPETTLPYDPADAGSMLRYWRRARGLSQQALGFEASVSARHLSFIETGKARPGRSLLVRLAGALEIPAREENALLEAAGHARRHSALALTDPRMDHMRATLSFLLDRALPNSAVVMDSAWNVQMANRAHHQVLEWFLGPSARDPRWGNLPRLALHPEGLRPYIVNLGEVADTLVRRIEREVHDRPGDVDLRSLLSELRGLSLPRPPRSGQPHGGLMLPMHFRKGSVEFRLFSVISTLGTPLDVTLQELRLESFFPADQASVEALGALEAGS